MLRVSVNPRKPRNVAKKFAPNDGVIAFNDIKSCNAVHDHPSAGFCTGLCFCGVGKRK